MLDSYASGWHASVDDEPQRSCRRTDSFAPSTSGLAATRWRFPIRRWLCSGKHGVAGGVVLIGALVVIPHGVATIECGSDSIGSSGSTTSTRPCSRLAARPDTISGVPDLRAFKTAARNWEAFGESDPFFGVLSDPTNAEADGTGRVLHVRSCARGEAAAHALRLGRDVRARHDASISAAVPAAHRAAVGIVSADHRRRCGPTDD
jgi:hypothetical protein